MARPLRPLDRLLLHDRGALFVSESALELEPLFEERSGERTASAVTVATRGEDRRGSLGFVTRHLLREDAIEEVPILKDRKKRESRRARQRRMWRCAPQALDLLLRRLHVHVDAPEIPSLRMRVDDALEDRFAALGVAELVFQLRELGDGLEV